jgi:hypothetical protein
LRFIQLDGLQMEKTGWWVCECWVTPAMKNHKIVVAINYLPTLFCLVYLPTVFFLPKILCFLFFCIWLQSWPKRRIFFIVDFFRVSNSTLQWYISTLRIHVTSLNVCVCVCVCVREELTKPGKFH